MFIIAGGMGKNISATAVLESFKKAYPQSHIIINTAFPYVWSNNPDIDEVLDLNRDFAFYAEKIKGKDITIFAEDVYHTEDFILKKSHLIDCWCGLLGIKSTTHQPKIFFTAEEQEAAKNKLFAAATGSGKPLFFIQTSGGAQNQRYPISWARDLPLPVAQDVVNEMNKRGYETIHIRRKNQPTLEHTTWINTTPREMMAMIPYSEKRLLIDSFAQHAAAALKLPSVVTWVSNSPDTFGYSLHTNLVADIQTSFRHEPGAYLERFDITGAIEQCPYDTNRLFDVTAILEALFA